MKTHVNNFLYTSFDVNGVPTKQGTDICSGAWIGVKVLNYPVSMLWVMHVFLIWILMERDSLEMTRQIENRIELAKCIFTWRILKSKWPAQLPYMPDAYGGASYYEDYKSRMKLLKAIQHIVTGIDIISFKLQ